MRRGFTLLEAIIVVTLLGLVGLSFGYLSSLSQRLMIQGMNSSTAQGEVAFALEHIKRHLTVATAIVTPATVAPAVGSSGNTLEFRWQRIVGGVVTDQTSLYDLINPVGGISDLQFTPGGGGAVEVIARGIRTGGVIPSLFTRATAETVSVNITAQKTTGGHTQEMRLQTNISPRGLSS